MVNLKCPKFTDILKLFLSTGWCVLHIVLQFTTKDNIVRILLVSIHYIHLGLFRSIWLCWVESNFLLRLIKRRLDSEKVIKIKVQDNYQVLGVWSGTNRSKRQTSKCLCLPNIGLVTSWQFLKVLVLKMCPNHFTKSNGQQTDS